MAPLHSSISLTSQMKSITGDKHRLSARLPLLLNMPQESFLEKSKGRESPSSPLRAMPMGESYLHDGFISSYFSPGDDYDSSPLNLSPYATMDLTRTNFASPFTGSNNAGLPLGSLSISRNGKPSSSFGVGGYPSNVSIVLAPPSEDDDDKDSAGRRQGSRVSKFMDKFA